MEVRMPPDRSGETDVGTIGKYVLANRYYESSQELFWGEQGLTCKLCSWKGKGNAGPGSNRRKGKMVCPWPVGGVYPEI